MSGRRARTGGIRRAVLASSAGVLALTLATTTGGAPADAAPGAPTPTTSPATGQQARIDSAESQVAALEAQISHQQVALDQADERYNQAVVELTSTRDSLLATSASIASTRERLTADRVNLERAAIAAYVGSASTESAAQIFQTPSTTSQTRYLYEKIGSGSIVADVARVKTGQRILAATKAKLLREEKAETAQLATEDRSRQKAAATSALSEATLAQVKGSLAQQIAQQAAAEAAQAARAAAAATTAAQRQAAADQASQAAQVASTVGGGSAAASSAVNSANQAAGAGTPGGPAPVSAGTAPEAAGLAAVHGAMEYLGVPYLWGGASGAGVDCSGLTMLAWAQAGVTLPHSAADQYAVSTHVSLSDLEPGDLLFYDLDGSGIDHVVMYVGPVLDGQPTAYGSSTIIQAAHTGTVVTFNPVWYFGLVGAARP